MIDIMNTEANERMRTILDASSRAVIMFDSADSVLYYNPAAYELMGQESKDALQVGFLEHIIKHTPELTSSGRLSVSVLDKLMNAKKDGEERFELELYIGGSLRFFDVEMKKIPYESSFAIVVYIIEITALREHERELIRTRELNELQLTKLQLVVRATKIVLWEMEIEAGDADPLNDDRPFIWSDEFRRQLGYADDNDFPNLVGSFHERLHPDDRERNVSMFKKHLMDKTGQSPYDIEVRILKKNGDYAYYRSSGESIRDEEGNPIRVAGAFMDISETKDLIHEAERQRMEAEAANRAKSAFLSTMSHEIRTPMNAILGITEILLQSESLDVNLREALEKIYTSGDMLLGIINDILDLSKIEAGKLEIMADKYDTASLISDTAQLNMMRIGSRPIEFELHVSENVPSQLSGDELRVKQILNNLLSNAFKYTEEGLVTLTVSAENSETSESKIIIIFEVSDTGQGMTKPQIERIFDEFMRFNPESNRVTEGTGLGMSITQNLLRLMNGNIAVESEPGVGSKFTVRLPQDKCSQDILGSEMAENLRQFRTRSRANMKRVQISREPMPYGSVLVVDDVETNIYVAKGLLAPYELKFESAGSGFSAIEKIKSGKEYDIIFMDHMMPQMDGIEATGVLRDIGYTLPIVALTANAVSGQAATFLNNGFDDFISKPIDVRQLNNVLNKLVRDKQPPDVLEATRLRAASAKDRESGNEAAKWSDMDPYAAKAFSRDATKAIVALEEIIAKGKPYSESDLRTYTIFVHGMRGALMNIGEKELSVVAKKLEQSGQAANSEMISSETPAFLSSLQAFLKSILPVKETQDVTDDAAISEDTPLLLEKLLIIRNACEEYDEYTADEALFELRNSSWQSATVTLLNKISDLLIHSEFEEIVEAVDIFVAEKARIK